MLLAAAAGRRDRRAGRVAIIAGWAVARSKAEVALANAAGYREMADDATDAAHQTSARLTSARLTVIDKQLAEVSSRLAGLETPLREVE